MKSTKVNFINPVLFLLLSVFCSSTFSESNGPVRLEVKLEKYESTHPWHEEREDGFDDGVAPLAKFRTLKPEAYSSREVSILFKSQHYKEQLPLMQQRVGMIFLIDVPADFLGSNANTIDAMYIRAMELKNP